MTSRHSTTRPAKCPHTRVCDDPTAYGACAHILDEEQEFAHAAEQVEHRVKQVRHKRPGGEVRTSMEEV